MIYTIYKTTNVVNGKFYIGVHKTSNPNDDYLGSGKYIKRAIKKYGIHSFNKEVLFVFETQQEAYKKEKELVTSNILESDMCYNLIVGGKGGFDFINRNGLCDHVQNGKTSGKRLKNKLKTDSDFVEEFSKRMSTTVKKTYENGRVSTFGDSETQTKWSKLAQTPEAINKKKATFAKNNHAQGKNNSQYGTCWIYKEVEGNKKIKLEELDRYIKYGWSKGRVGNNANMNVKLCRIESLVDCNVANVV